ncbi:hypothetical protein SANA_20900 [Gottschalkiaceae bacterium SANA]|nr:hypothetical protein SANA_20900 [Gottschalkiaceae bacterium SANA]
MLVKFGYLLRKCKISLDEIWKYRYTSDNKFKGGGTMKMTMMNWRWQMNELTKKADNMGQVRLFAV